MHIEQERNFNQERWRFVRYDTGESEEMLQDLGKTFIVWGDLVLGKEPGVLPSLDKSIVIMDWNYWDTDPVPFRNSLEKVRVHGARGIGAPGLISYRWGPRPGTSQLGNIDAFADVYLTSQNPASLGVILTNWVPSRYIQNSLWDGFAYAAVAFNRGSAAARSGAFRNFVQRHWAAPWSDTWSNVVWDKSLIFNPDGKTEKARRHVPLSDRVRDLLRVRAQGAASEWAFRTKEGCSHQLLPCCKAVRQSTGGGRSAR